MPKDPYAPMSIARLTLVYLALWLGCGLIVLCIHLLCAPDYIDTSTRIVGGLANLFGPWARLLATGWPNAGKPPHTPSVAIGVFVLVLMGAVVLASGLTDNRWLQRLCIVAFVPLVALWLGAGLLELMVCAE
jgi:hypothetical protein